MGVICIPVVFKGRLLEWAVEDKGQDLSCWHGFPRLNKIDLFRLLTPRFSPEICQW